MGAVDQAMDFATTRAGTLAGKYMRRFWHPVYRSEDLPAGHAKPAMLMSEPLTLYRGQSGTPYAVAQRCAHRGLQLSLGWVEKESIRCFYHGWKYDPSGQCTEQPAEDAGYASKVSIRAFPVREYLGLIFVYLGEGVPPELPRYPELEQEGVLEVGAFTRPCNYFQNLENSLDEVHLAFVHSNSPLADRGLVDIPKISVEETEYGILRYGKRGDAVRVGHFIMPNALYVKLALDYSDDGKAWQEFVVWRVPIDDEHHINLSVTLAALTGEAAERHRQRRAAQTAGKSDRGWAADVENVSEEILAGRRRVHDLKDGTVNIQLIQDYVAMVGQGPIADRASERLGRSDAGIVLLRRIWERELRALAAGGPLKEWSRARALETTTGL